jgi:hypothetical protein
MMKSAAAQALQWEAYLDVQFGVHLRRWFYHNVLPDRDCALNFILQRAAWYARPLFAVIFPKVRLAKVVCSNSCAPSNVILTNSGFTRLLGRTELTLLKSA